MNKLISLCFVLILGLNFLSAQDFENDTLVQKFNSAKEPDLKAELAIKISEKYQNKDLSSSENYANRALDLVKKVDNPELISEIYFQLAYLKYKVQKDSEALGYFDQLDSVSLKHNLITSFLIKSKLYRAEISKFTYSEEGLKRMRDYLTEMKSLARSIKDSINEHMADYRIGDWHYTMAQVEEPEMHSDSARNYFNKALLFFKEQKDMGTMLRIYQDLYALEMQLENTNEAENNLRKKLEMAEEYNDSIEMAKSYYLLGRFHRITGNFHKSIRLFDKASHIFGKTGYPNSDYKLKLINNYTITYDSLKDYRNAYVWSTKSYQLKDSIDRNRSRSLTVEMQTKYQSEKKEQEIDLLKSKAELDAQKQTTQRNLLLSGIGITSLAGIFLFVLYRNRQKTNSKLKELDSAKSKFFENISHEFRTPLTLINAPINEQLSKKTLKPEEKHQLEIAKRNSNRLLELVDQILDLSKLESGNYRLKVGAYNLKEFIRGLVSSYEYKAKQKKQEFTIQLKLTTSEHWFDRDVLEKIINNLLTNALKYSPQEAQIDLLIFEDKGQVKLEIINSGAPIPQEELKRIFSRFHRNSENEVGSGIGLALTKELVELHKGEISVWSDTNKVGFVVTLPIIEKSYNSYKKITDYMKKETKIAQTQVNDPEYDDEYETNESKSSLPVLLIVEDNKDLQDYLNSIFKDRFSVHLAENGLLGVEKAIELVPDIIITDLMMPVKDGLQLTQACKTHDLTSHIPIIMLTAKATDENKLEGLETGADAYITKPFETKIVEATVTNLLENRKKLQERFSKEVILTPKDIAISSYEQRFLENLQEAMDSHLIESDFSAEKFAVALGMSRMQLHRKLKALTGLSTTEFIRSQRLKLAAQLLKESDVNVSQVGYAVGFNNHSYFTKCFREQFGVSPTTYSKK